MNAPLSLLCMLFAVGFPSSVGAQQNDRKGDERAIRLLIQQREAAWNAGDISAYGRLLTDDADLLSATGRSAENRQSILDLYVEQRAGAYKGGYDRDPG